MPNEQNNFGDTLKVFVRPLQIAFLAWIAYLLVVGGPYFYLLSIDDQIALDDNLDEVRRKAGFLKVRELSECEFLSGVPGGNDGQSVCCRELGCADSGPMAVLVESCGIANRRYFAIGYGAIENSILIAVNSEEKVCIGWPAYE